MHTATVSIHGAIGPVTTQSLAKTYLQPAAKSLLIMIYQKDSYRFNKKFSYQQINRPKQIVIFASIKTIYTMSGRTEIINIKNPSDKVLKILKKMQSRKEQRHTDFLNELQTTNPWTNNEQTNWYYNSKGGQIKSLPFFLLWKHYWYHHSVKAHPIWHNWDFYWRKSHQWPCNHCHIQKNSKMDGWLYWQRARYNTLLFLRLQHAHTQHQTKQRSIAGSIQKQPVFPSFPKVCYTFVRYVGRWNSRFWRRKPIHFSHTPQGITFYSHQRHSPWAGIHPQHNCRAKMIQKGSDPNCIIWLVFHIAAAVGFEPTYRHYKCCPLPLRYAAWTGILILLPGPQVGR